MPRKLTEEQVKFFNDNGYVHPIPVFSPAEIARYRALYEAFERERPDEAPMAFRAKPNMVFTWLDEMARHPAILDAVEDVIGPNILVWSAGFFTKNAHDPGYVSWHQDATYWGLKPDDVVTAWIAFSDSTAENGAMQVVPGTHKWDQIAHNDTFADTNLLSRGQEIAVDVDEKDAVTLELKAGEMSLHHVKIVHGSKANNSDQRRIGFTIRYVPTYVRQVGVRDTAMLVRGVDEYGHFDPETPPKVDYGAAEIAQRDESLRRAAANLFRGAKGKSKSSNYQGTDDGVEAAD